MLLEGGLRPALKGLIRRSGLPATLGAVPEERLEQPVEAAAYFLVAEALTNVARHAPDATSVEIELERRDGLLLIDVRDDGAGGADASGGGLSGLADRVAAVDGRLDVRSPAGAS